MNKFIKGILVGLSCIVVIGVTKLEVNADTLQTKQDDLAKYTNELDKLAVKNEENEKKITELNKKIEENNKNIDTYETKKKDYSEIVKENLKKVQVKGNVGIVELLLSGDNLKDSLNNWSASKVLLSSQQEQVVKLKDVTTNLTKEKSNLAKNKEEVENLKKEIETNKAELIDKKGTVLQELVKLNKDYSSELEQFAKENNSALKNVTKENKIINDSYEFIGLPYVWGGTSPITGFDCSGFMQYIFRENGIELPRVSEDQSTVGTYVELSDLQAGDLVFWGGIGTAHHVGLYLGEGLFIHAPTVGDSIKINSLQEYTPNFGKRIIE